MEELQKPIVVLAGNYQNFSYWCRKHNVNPLDRNVTYINHPSQLRGRCICPDCVELIRYETFPEHQNFLEIYEVVERAKLMGHIGG